MSKLWVLNIIDTIAKIFQAAVSQKSVKAEVSEHVKTWIEEASKITHSKNDNYPSYPDNSLDQSKETFDRKSKSATNESTTEQSEIDDPFYYIQRIGANSRAAASISNASTNSANEKDLVSSNKSEADISHHSVKKAESATSTNLCRKNNEVRTTESTPKSDQGVQEPYDWPYADNSGQSVENLNLVPAGMQSRPAQAFQKCLPRRQFVSFPPA